MQIENNQIPRFQDSKKSLAGFFIFARDFFIPSEKNGFMPRGLSWRLFLVYLSIGILLVLLPRISIWPIASIINLVPFKSTELITLINQSRQTSGLPALLENPLLNAAAEDKARDMLKKQYFAHVAPDQKQPWDFIKSRGYQFGAAGENLAVDFPTAPDTHNALMNSSSHRGNIFNKAFDEIGTAVVSGMFENHPSIIVVEFFAKPKTISTPAAIGQETAQQKEILPSPVVTDTLKKLMPLPKQIKLEAIASPVQVQSMSSVILLLIALPLVFFVLRLGRAVLASFGVLFRSAVVAAIFLYLVLFGAREIANSPRVGLQAAEITLSK